MTTKMIDASDLLATATEAALLAGTILLDGYSQTKEIRYKDGNHNLVTQFDVASEKAIIDLIRQRYSDHLFLAEESGGSEEAGGYRWIIDPLDGTVNFAHGIPIFSVSIAAEYNGEVLAGVVYQPVTRELFKAVKGGGSTLNDVPIHVSQSTSLARSIVVTGFPYNAHENAAHTLEHFCALVNMGVPIRRLGSAAVDLAYVACGRFDGFWESALKPWDMAAGALLVREAGGTITDFSGIDHHYEHATILSTNSLIHQEFLSFLQHAPSNPLR